MEICVPRLLSHAPLPLRRPPSHPFACFPPVPAFPPARNGARTTLLHFPKSVEQHKNATFAARSSTSEDISASISMQLDEQPGKKVITDEPEAAEEVDESPKKCETPVPTVEVTPPEDISAIISRQLDEQPGKVVITDETEAAEEVYESPKKYKTPVPTVEVTPSEEPTESQFQSFQLFGDFNLELKEEDIYPILLYGGGSLLTLWISFAIIGAIDSIPLIPKMLEVVGLGYMVWFSYQYLIFKKNRDELVAKIEGLRKEIIGGSEDV